MLKHKCPRGSWPASSLHKTIFSMHELTTTPCFQKDNYKYTCKSVTSNFHFLYTITKNKMKREVCIFFCWKKLFSYLTAYCNSIFNRWKVLVRNGGLASTIRFVDIVANRKFKLLPIKQKSIYSALNVILKRKENNQSKAE